MPHKPSIEIVDKQAFAIVSKLIHFGFNSGLSCPFPSSGFISLQEIRTSCTLRVIEDEVESRPFTES